VLSDIANNFDETLEDDKKKDIDWAACSPFAFLQFFNKVGAALIPEFITS
jgi:hypothetical protein